MARFGFLSRIRGLGRMRGSVNKKYRLGLSPSGMNEYTYPVFTYDLAKVSWWTDQSNNRIFGLDMAYVWAPGVGGKSWNGYNTTTDGSQLDDYAEGGPLRNTVKMSLDGTLDMTSLAALSITELRLYLPQKYNPSWVGTVLQIRFDQPIVGMLLGGSGYSSLVSDDGGAGYNWRITISSSAPGGYLRIPVSAGSVASMQIRRPRIVPHPGGAGVTRHPSAATPEPVGNPDEIRRWRAAGTILRNLDTMRINFYQLGGDTVSSMRLLTSIPTDYLFGLNNPKVSMAEMVAMCNEAGAGIHACAPYRLDPASIPTYAAQLAQVNGPVAIEFGNENWNTGFIQNAELPVLGVRRGFANRTRSAGATPVNALYPYRHQTSTTTMAHTSGDMCMYIQANNYGVTLFRARTDLPSGTVLPVCLNSTTTSSILSAGTLVLTNVSRTLYQVKAGQTAPAGTAVTNTTYFQAFPFGTDDATALASGVSWECALYNWEARNAAWNYASWMTQQLGDAVDAARAALGKSRSIKCLNVIGSNQVRIDVSASGNDAGWMLQFDDMWRKVDFTMSSLYCGESALPSQSNYLLSYLADTGSDWTVAAKQAVYRTDITANQAVDAAVALALSPNTRAYIISAYIAQCTLFQNRASFGLTTIMETLRQTHNAAFPGDIVAPGNFRPYFGVYEFGGPGNDTFSNPDQNASGWSSGTTYTAGWTIANFAKDGGQLYRCSGTPTVGLAPHLDLTNWSAITSYTDPYDGQVYPRWAGVFNAIWHHPNMQLFVNDMFAAFETFAHTYQSDTIYLSAYTSIRATVAGFNQAYGFRFGEDETLAVSPAWYGLLQNKARWDNLS